jgi:hypothetical protein
VPGQVLRKGEVLCQRMAHRPKPKYKPHSFLGAQYRAESRVLYHNDPM